MPGFQNIVPTPITETDKKSDTSDGEGTINEAYDEYRGVGLCRTGAILNAVGLFVEQGVFLINAFAYLLNGIPL